MSRVATTRNGKASLGRLDLLAIRLLENAVSTHGDLPMLGIYGTFKPQIDRAIRQHLGPVRFYFPEPDEPAKPILQKREAKPRHKRIAEAEPMTMELGADGVYEVDDVS